MRRSIGASMTKGAVRASHRRPAMKVAAASSAASSGMVMSAFSASVRRSKNQYALSSCVITPLWWCLRANLEAVPVASLALLLRHERLLKRTFQDIELFVV